MHLQQTTSVLVCFIDPSRNLQISIKTGLVSVRHTPELPPKILWKSDKIFYDFLRFELFSNSLSRVMGSPEK